MCIKQAIESQKSQNENKLLVQAIERSGLYIKITMYKLLDSIMQ